MPILKDFRRTKIIILKDYEGSEVEIYDSLLAKDTDLNFTMDSKDINLVLKNSSKFIKSWNFFNEENQPLEINETNLGLLKTEALTEIFNAITEFTNEVKKNN